MDSPSQDDRGAPDNGAPRSSWFGTATRILNVIGTVLILLMAIAVNADVAACAREASEFYARFPGRARRLMIARQSPGLTAFADAFRLRKD